MKTIFRAFVIAFSMYSKIPMPRIDWEEKGMRYALCFFPCIGVVLGVLMTGMYVVLEKLGLGITFQAVVFTLLPIWLTGGIHMDGFMDTMDAMSSYQPKEKRLEILKDSHIGAFAAMSVVGYLLLFFGAATELKGINDLILLSVCFVISRAMSALCFVTCQSARKDGLQRTFADAMQKKTVAVSSSLYLIVSLGVCFSIDLLRAGILAIAILCLYIYYRRFSGKNFGGITGDLAGYYLQIQEMVYLLIIVLFR